MAGGARHHGTERLDGFDVLSISFASPGIAEGLGIDKANLGWVLSMELLGMALGSCCLPWRGRQGREAPDILACLVGMAVGMFGAGYAHGVPELLAWRC